MGGGGESAEQRLAGVTIGAALAALVLLTAHDVIALGVIIAVLGGLAVSLVGVNYAWYYAAMTAVVLISLDLPHPSDLADEARRVLFTLIGVAIAVLVLFLADLLAQRAPATVRPAGRLGRARGHRGRRPDADGVHPGPSPLMRIAARLSRLPRRDVRATLSPAELDGARERPDNQAQGQQVQ